MDKANIIFATIMIAIVALGLLSGCKKEVAEDEPTLPSDSSVPTSRNGVVGNQKLIADVSRLAKAASTSTITKDDIVQLIEEVKGDEGAEREAEEIGILVKHQEYTHASHALSGLGSYLQSGKETLCPAHALAHYYVFLRDDEPEYAADALTEAKESLDEWIPAARQYNERYPSGIDVDELTAKLRAHIEGIDAGNTSVSEEDIMDFTENGLCIEA